jgi:hypothetical protein
MKALYSDAESTTGENIAGFVGAGDNSVGIVASGLAEPCGLELEKRSFARLT